MAIERFDHRVLAGTEAHALARHENVVAELGAARQPDAAFDHREFTAEAAELQRLAGGHALEGGPFELRIHH